MCESTSSGRVSDGHIWSGGPSTPGFPEQLAAADVAIGQHGNGDSILLYIAYVVLPVTPLFLFARLLDAIERHKTSHSFSVTSFIATAASSSHSPPAARATCVYAHRKQLHCPPRVLLNTRAFTQAIKPATPQATPLQLPTRPHHHLGGFPPRVLQPIRHDDRGHVDDIQHIQREAQAKRTQVLCRQGRPHTGYLPQLGGLQGADGRDESEL